MRTAVLVVAALLLGVPARSAEDVQVVVAGKPHGSVPAYVVGGERYLSAKEAGAVYGAQVYWYPVSGRVQMSLRGRSAQFFVNSNEARLGEKTIKLPTDVLLRASQAWIPLSFLKSEAWAGWVGSDTSYDAKTQILMVDRRSSLGPARWYSYGEYTRIALDLDPRASYSASPRGVGGMEVSIPLGTVDPSQNEKLDDGLVSALTLSQGPKAAKLSVRFAEPGLKYRVHEAANPRRLVVDIYKTEPPAVAELPMTPPASPSSPSETAGAHAKSAEAPVTPPALPSKDVTIGPRPVIPAQPSISPKRRIVVDAGHGGKDPGASSRRGIQEKDIALAAAKELAGLLEEEPRFEVTLTREDDTFVELSGRTEKANKLEADLFISLHCNAARNRGESGFEVYFLSEKASDPEAERLAEQENSVIELEGKSHKDVEAELLLGELAKTEFVNQSSELASLVAKSVEKRVEIENRGVKQAGFYVLRGTHAPAVLFEMAFLTNTKDEARLHSKRFRRKMIDGIYAGVRDYARRQGWLTPQTKGK